MSEAIEVRMILPGDDAYLEATWQLKERIRRVDGVLEQERSFFTFQYRRCEEYLLVEGDESVAFAVVRPDSYLCLLGVDPTRRRRGHGRRLVARVAENHGTVTCHTRTDNDGTVAFYTDLGFVVVERIEGYYSDGTDAYYLRLSDDGTSRLDRVMDVLDE